MPLCPGAGSHLGRALLAFSDFLWPLGSTVGRLLESMAYCDVYLYAKKGASSILHRINFRHRVRHIHRFALRAPLLPSLPVVVVVLVDRMELRRIPHVV